MIARLMSCSFAVLVSHHPTRASVSTERSNSASDAFSRSVQLENSPTGPGVLVCRSGGDIM